MDLSGLYLVMALLGDADAAAASSAIDPEPEVDTSAWPCEYCAFEEGLDGWIRLGGGYISDDSAKFGDYRGLDNEGGYAVAGAELRYWGNDARYWQVSASDLGLESRSLRVEGGRQGRYVIGLSYDELPKRRSDDTVSPFRGLDGNVLTLPQGFRTAGRTDRMPDLSNSLRAADLGHKRETLGLDFTIFASPNLDYSVALEHETKDGRIARGGSFLTDSAILPAPVDWETNTVDVAASYTADDWQLQAAYHGSFFRNDHRGVIWDNPFTALAPGADRGRLATEPDNQFHQFSLSGAYNLTSRINVSGSAAVGRMSQNEDFLASTVNPQIVSPTLPRDDLDGEVNTLSFNGRVVYRTPIQGLRLKAEYSYDDRDNDTPQDAYRQVFTDTLLTNTRVNLPYSFERSEARVRADYRVASRLSIAAGGRFKQHDRTFQQVDETETRAGWVEVSTQPLNAVSLKLRAERSDRDALGFRLVEEVIPAQNPLLRKFNLAPRDRDELEAQLSVTPFSALNVTLSANYADDDYDRTELGVVEADEQSYTLDASLTPWRSLQIYGFGAHEEVDWRMQGSQRFAGPDWTGITEDRINTAGLGVKGSLLEDQLELGADLTHAESEGDVTVLAGAGDPPFPNFDTRRSSVRLYGAYQVRERATVRLDLYYERFRSDDFLFDGVQPTTLPDVLTLGELAPRYDVTVATLSVRYDF